MYKNFLFDCDGVILNSNKVKTDGFYYAAKDYGHEEALKLQIYHKLNGGISRYQKFKFFLNDILKVPFTKDIYDDLLNKYSNYVSSQLLKCDLADNLINLRKIFSMSNWMVVSGGDQIEIKKLFTLRSIDYLFNGGIFGSPLNKYEIFESLFFKRLNKKESIYLGDSLYDYEVASYFGVDFRYIEEWSEFELMQSHAKKNNLKVHTNLQEFFLEIQGGLPESHNS